MPFIRNSTAAVSAPATAQGEFPAEVVSNLTTMGFPEAEVLACLRASRGNPDAAVEFLMNGIPPAATASAPSSGGEPLAALRSHPQFDALRRLVQSNPSTLQAVLTQIGQQQPQLLDAMANPAQMAQMLSNLNPTELNDMAAMMGIAPDQLTGMAQMIGQMGNQDQFQDYLMQAMMQGGQPGAQPPQGPAPHMLRLTEEEMAAVDRLTEMGFDRSEAAQAFLACDKNEALAANLLMDSAGDGGFGFAGDFGTGPPSGGNSGGNADDGDDMYD